MGSFHCCCFISSMCAKDSSSGGAGYMQAEGLEQREAVRRCLQPTLGAAADAAAVIGAGADTAAAALSNAAPACIPSPAAASSAAAAAIRALRAAPSHAKTALTGHSGDVQAR
ncbi:unnamed protein product [Closterium sp. NIES-54]